METKKKIKVAVVCNFCGKKFSVAAMNFSACCPKCKESDFDVL